MAFALSIVCEACAATSEQVRGPDGGWWWQIDCHHSQSECWDEAAADCPHGYVTADESGRESGATVYSTFVQSHYRGQMLVKCRDQAATEVRCDDEGDCPSGLTCKHFPGDRRGRCR